MLTLLNMVRDKIAALLDGDEFWQPNESWHAMRYYVGNMPKKRSMDDQVEDYPFCLVKPGSFGARKRDNSSLSLSFVIGLYDPLVSSFLETADEIIANLEELTTENYAPYKLISDVEIRYSDIGEPYYSLDCELEFVKTKKYC